MSRTLAIIKPDAFAGNKAGLILAHLEKGGFRLIASRVMKMTREQAGEFYAVHKGRPFYPELVEFMTSGYCMPMVLERDNAVQAWRDLMGATDPAKAAAGTIRKVHARSIGENSVHGSDAPETAAKEIAQFFAGNEVVG